MPLCVLLKNLACALVFLVYDSLNFLVDALCTFLAVGFREAIVFAAVVVRDIWQSIAHAVIGNHGIGNLGCTLKIVEGAGVDDAQEHFLGHTSSHERANLVEQCLSWSDLSLLGHIPCSTQRLSAWDDCYLYQWVAILEVPAHGSMPCLVDGNGVALFLGHDLGAFLKAANYTVNCIVEVLLLHSHLLVTCGDKGSLVAHVGNVGAREAWCLS